MPDSNEHWHVAQDQDGILTVPERAAGTENRFLTQEEATKRALMEGPAHSPLKCLLDHPDTPTPERQAVRAHIGAHCNGRTGYQCALRQLDQATQGNWSHQSEFIRRNRGWGLLGLLLTAEEDQPDLVRVRLTIPVKEGELQAEGTAEIIGKYQEDYEDARREALRNAIISLKDN